MSDPIVHMLCRLDLVTPIFSLLLLSGFQPVAARQRNRSNLFSHKGKF